MNEIVLTEEQTRFIENAQEPLVIRDARGNEVTRIDPIDFRIAAEHRSRGLTTELPVPAAEVEAFLATLHAEKESTGAVSLDRAKEIMIGFLPRDSA